MGAYDEISNWTGREQCATGRDISDWDFSSSITTCSNTYRHYICHIYIQTKRERERESDISTAYSFVLDWDPIYILTRWCTPTYPTCVVGHINPPEVLNFRRRLEVHALERSIHLRPQSHRAPRGGLKSSEDFIILEPQKQTWMGSCIQQTL